MSGNWNEYNLNILTRIHWRASLVIIDLLTPEIVIDLSIASLLNRQAKLSNCRKPSLVSSATQAVTQMQSAAKSDF